jgi:hypothetical protein
MKVGTKHSMLANVYASNIRSEFYISSLVKIVSCLTNYCSETSDWNQLINSDCLMALSFSDQTTWHQVP